MEKEIGSNNDAVNKLKSEYDGIKGNWRKCNGFYTKYADEIKNEKEKTCLENIVKEIGKLSKNIERKFSEYKINANQLSESICKKINGKKMILKSELESFRKALNDLKTIRCELENLKSDFESKVKDYSKFVENIKSKIEKQLKDLSSQFDKIEKHFNESFESINKEYEKLETLKKRFETAKSDADKSCERDKKKKGEIATIYKNFRKAENKLLHTLRKSTESLKYSFELYYKKGENFKNILSNKSKEVFVKEEECTNILGEIKSIKKCYYDPLLGEVKEEIKKLNELYNNTKTALLNYKSQGILSWLKGLF